MRISTHKKAFNFTMADARTGLDQFLSERNAVRIPDDLPALDSKPATSEQVTDHYLADLAAKHGIKLATLDTGVKHAAVELIS